MRLLIASDGLSAGQPVITLQPWFGPLDLPLTPPSIEQRRSRSCSSTVGAVVVVVALLPSAPVSGSGPAPLTSRECATSTPGRCRCGRRPGDVVGEAGRLAGLTDEKEMTMSSYVLAFRGRPDRTPQSGEDEAWGAWFGRLGSAIADCGNRVGTSIIK